eukprot:4100329-Pleurochrysis_carterae.AAC.1
MGMQEQCVWGACRRKEGEMGQASQDGKIGLRSGFLGHGGKGRSELWERIRHQERAERIRDGRAATNV